MQLNLISEVPVLIIGGIIGIVLQFIVIKLERWYFSNNKPMHGTWYEILPEFQGVDNRVDIVKIIQQGNRLTGQAWRVIPKAEKKRKWHFEGYVTDTRLIGFFYIKNKKIDPSSYIPIIMVQDPSARAQALWRGHYYRPEFENDENIISGNVELGKMLWQRNKPTELKGQGLWAFLSTK